MSKKVEQKLILVAPMKKFTFSLAERIFVTAFLKEVKGTADLVSLAFDDIKKVMIFKEENEKIGIEEVKNDKGEVMSLKWDPKKEKLGEKEVEMYPEVVDYILKSIKDKSEKGEFTMADLPIIELRKKLEAKAA